MTVSSDGPAVPQVLSAPTVSANGELPGDVMPPRTAPVGGLAVVARGGDDDDAGAVAFATASHSGSVRDGSVTGWPSDRLMTRML